jgi:hypothetical protein
MPQALHRPSTLPHHASHHLTATLTDLTVPLLSSSCDQRGLPVSDHGAVDPSASATARRAGGIHRTALAVLAWDSNRQRNNRTHLVLFMNGGKSSRRKKRRLLRCSSDMFNRIIGRLKGSEARPVFVQPLGGVDIGRARFAKQARHWDCAGATDMARARHVRAELGVPTVWPAPSFGPAPPPSLRLRLCPTRLFARR